MPTAAFVLHQSESYKDDHLANRVRAAVQDMSLVSAGKAAEQLFGDGIYGNLMLAGAAFQRGWLPLSLAAIEEAITLNGVAVDQNLAAFHAGRLLAAAPERLLPDHDDQAAPETLDDRIERLATELERYADGAYAGRFKGAVATVRLAETALGTADLPLTQAVAKNLFKLMAYKDEYEVARLHSDPEFRAGLRAEFGVDAKLSIKLAPPLLARTDPRTGRPAKMSFGPWVFPLLSGLARLKHLRGTWFDPFGWTAERRLERTLIDDYERTLREIIGGLSPERHEMAVEIASIPDGIRGYGPIKAAAIEAARLRERDLIKAFHDLSQSGSETVNPWLIAAE